MRAVIPMLLGVLACGTKSPQLAAGPVSAATIAGALTEPLPPRVVSGPIPVIDDSTATESPRLLKVGRRDYPAELEGGAVSGRVVLQFIVMEDGQVNSPSIRILEYSHPGFRQAAINMVLSSQFAPGELYGRKVRVRVKQTVTWVGS